MDRRKSYLFLICFLNLVLFAQDSSFDCGMRGSALYAKNKNNQSWLRTKKMYETATAQATVQTDQTIPKIIHHIWIGSSLPALYAKYRKTWIDMHPDWEHKLWTDEDINKFGLKNKKAYDSAVSYGEKSDIARYEILYKFGGLYVDTDFECLKSFSDLHHKYSFYAGIIYDAQPVLNNALIASKPGHSVMKACIDAIANNVSPSSMNANKVFERSGPYLFTRCFFSECNKEPLTVAFPPSYFYPLPNFKKDDVDHQKWITPDSYAIHHWACSWVNKKVN